MDFEIDQLTNSIVNVYSGDVLQTAISLISVKDLKIASKKNGWQFNWGLEFRDSKKEVYKLFIVHNQSVIQGLVSFELKPDHVYMHLVESAPFNRGSGKVYEGVLGNLVAFGCQLSYQRGFGGNLAFLSKTKLIDHYINKLEAFHAGRGLMIITPRVAMKLILRYFKQEKL